MCKGNREKPLKLGIESLPFVLGYHNSVLRNREKPLKLGIERPYYLPLWDKSFERNREKPLKLGIESHLSEVPLLVVEGKQRKTPKTGD